jgi:hypothetical protein
MNINKAFKKKTIMMEDMYTKKHQFIASPAYTFIVFLNGLLVMNRPIFKF